MSLWTEINARAHRYVNRAYRPLPGLLPAALEARDVQLFARLHCRQFAPRARPPVSLRSPPIRVPGPCGLSPRCVSNLAQNGIWELFT